MVRSPISTLQVRGADPDQRTRTAQSQFDVSPGQAEDVFDQAEIHGVLGAVLNYLSPHAGEPSIAAVNGVEIQNKSGEDGAPSPAMMRTTFTP